MVLILKYLVPKSYTAITLYPFIFLVNPKFKLNAILINHEKIHLRQQIELLIIPFYLWYGIEFLVRFIYFRNWNMAYKNISFEREAYLNEQDFHYLKNRKFWNFLKYLSLS